MTFTGYCTNAELVSFLDFGSWTTYTIESYDSANTYILPVTIANGLSSNLISGMISATDDGVAIPAENYTVDVTSGVIAFVTGKHPVNKSTVVFKYYLCREFTNADISYYILLGARKLELDTKKLFREAEVEYTTDGNEGYDYIHYTNSRTIELPYAINTVEDLEINGVTVTPSTLKIINNKISLTPNSEVKEFSGEANSVVVTVTHGILDDSKSLEDERFLDLAKEANKRISALMIIDSPLGRNVTLDNAYMVQKSDGSVRPDIAVDSIVKRYEDSYNMLKELLMNSTTSLI